MSWFGIIFGLVTAFAIITYVAGSKASRRNVAIGEFLVVVFLSIIPIVNVMLLLAWLLRWATYSGGLDKLIEILSRPIFRFY